LWKGAKHTPYITFNDSANTATVLVGSEEGEIHPMVGSLDGVTEPHWITEIWIVDDQGFTQKLNALDPTGVEYASIEFTPPSDSKTLTAYIWCNIHGLYVGPTVDVPVKENDTALDTNPNPESSARSAIVSFSSLLAAALSVFFL
jgi:desulfoferrodoxin (superoxide reductase-like protein)